MNLISMLVEPLVLYKINVYIYIFYHYLQYMALHYESTFYFTGKTEGGGFRGGAKIYRMPSMN